MFKLMCVELNDKLVKICNTFYVSRNYELTIKTLVERNVQCFVQPVLIKYEVTFKTVVERKCSVFLQILLIMT